MIDAFWEFHWIKWPVSLISVSWLLFLDWFFWKASRRNPHSYVYYNPSKFSMDNVWMSKSTCANMTLEIPTSNKHRTSRRKKPIGDSNWPRHTEHVQTSNQIMFNTHTSWVQWVDKEIVNNETCTKLNKHKSILNVLSNIKMWLWTKIK